MKSLICILLVLEMASSACTSTTRTINPKTRVSQTSTVLTNDYLIDGTGTAPIPNSTLVISGKHIIAIGPADKVLIPSGAEVIDLGGATILPGFINAHVHDAYNEGRLEAWAQAGVINVRDEGIISGPGQLSKLITLRNRLAVFPQYARLVSAGYMLSVPGG